MKVSDAFVGAKIEKLTIINILNKRNKFNKLIAECICDCGLYIKTTINNLGNSTKSCGCLKKERNKSFGKSIYYNNAKKVLDELKKKTPNTNLSINDIYNLVFSNCFYCEKSINEVGNVGTAFGIDKKRIKKIGIDRINNDIGYYSDNVASCCFKCNRIKLNSSINYIINNFNIISNNASKLINNSFIQNNKDEEKIIIEHNEKCDCFTNKNYVSSIQDRTIKIVKNRLVHRKVGIDITNDFLKKIIFSNRCFYCEKEICEVGNLFKRNGYGINLCKIRALGVDRIDSNIGYMCGNVIECCKYCNILKSDYSVSDFSNVTKNIYDKIVKLHKDGKIKYEQ